MRHLTRRTTTRYRSRDKTVQKVRGDRKGVKAVGGALEPPLLPSPEPILAHQPGDASATDGKPIVAKFVHHARAAVGPVRKGEGRADMSQQHHIVGQGWDSLVLFQRDLFEPGYDRGSHRHGRDPCWFIFDGP